jgi:ABC-type transport system involved in multi-copper enzyme maturation permease subunit
MSFLPIVQRELRVSSRRKVTYYARCVVAGIGMVMSFLFLLIAEVGGPRNGAGNFAFTVVSWYALLTTSLAGVFLASDSLSEERREGTLGLLFLTDLKGYDVVLGKFMAVSLNTFYGLLAVFPILAISLLAGGVTGAEFWRTCLALLNILFFAVATAMLISSLSTSSSRAMTGAIAALVICLTGTIVSSAANTRYAAIASPFMSFLTASDAEYFLLAHLFWIALAVSHVVGWIFLGLAAWRIKFFANTEKGGSLWRQNLSKNVLEEKSGRRTKLLETNPVLLLLGDSRRISGGVRALVLLALIGIAVAMGGMGPSAVFFLGYATWPFYFLLKIFVAIQACRFFVEARRTGALELICCTPITMKAIIQGQWILLRRVFLWPLVVLLLTHAAALVYISMHGGQTGLLALPGFGSFFLLWTAFKVIPNNLADFFAIGWFGMWLALSMQRPNQAAAVTILSVLILPMIAVCVPTLATDAIFIAVGWTKLSEDFRLRQAQWVSAKGGI